MLRECFRGLKPGGRIAGYSIHCPTGSSPSEELRASELGPSDVASPTPQDEMARSLGFTIIADKDVTDVFLVTCEAILRAREQLGEKLRAEEGDEGYEEEQGKKHSMLTGIREGLLHRSLIVATKPSST